MTTTTLGDPDVLRLRERAARLRAEAERLEAKAAERAEFERRRLDFGARAEHPLLGAWLETCCAPGGSAPLGEALADLNRFRAAGGAEPLGLDEFLAAVEEVGFQVERDEVDRRATLRGASLRATLDPIQEATRQRWRRLLEAWAAVGRPPLAVLAQRGRPTARGAETALLEPSSDGVLAERLARFRDLLVAHVATRLGLEPAAREEGLTFLWAAACLEPCDTDLPDWRLATDFYWWARELAEPVATVHPYPIGPRRGLAWGDYHFGVALQRLGLRPLRIEGEHETWWRGAKLRAKAAQPTPEPLDPSAHGACAGARVKVGTWTGARLAWPREGGDAA